LGAMAQCIDTLTTSDMFKTFSINPLKLSQWFLTVTEVITIAKSI